MLKPVGITLAVVFVVMGAVLTMAASLAVARGHLVFSLALPLPVATFGLGILMLRSFAYEVKCNEHGISMYFAFWKKSVSWDHVECYKYLGLRGRFKGGANIFVMLKYKIPNTVDLSLKRAFMVLQGTGPSLGMSTKQYTTELDQYIPDKKGRIRSYKKDQSDLRP